ncbi:MAG: peptidase M22 glycoprotease [uncultured bacterium]|nr:MAG: peptidase M22 glycoprotease [uncultured bacterium]
MTRILAIDTSTDACSAALLCGNKIYDRFAIAPQQHTKLLLPMVHELLAEVQLTLNQLDAIAFGCGPGSFTGIRLAASVVQGLAYAANLPVVKVSTLCALAQEVYKELGNPMVLVAQDARMQEIYWGKYRVDNEGIMRAVVPDQLIAPQKVVGVSDNGWIGVGNGWKIYGDILTKHCNIPIVESKIYPQAKYITQIAAVDFSVGLMVSAEEALPTYLREEVAWT